MPKLIDADSVRRIILSHGGDGAMLREIERLPDGDVVQWEFLERYADWFCADVSMPQFVREAKQFYQDSNRAMTGGHIGGDE